MSDVVVDRSWTFVDAAEAAWRRYRGGGVMGTSFRNQVLRTWGNVVGRDRAVADLHEFTQAAGGIGAAARSLGMAESTLRGLRDYFASLPVHLSAFGGASIDEAIDHALRSGENSKIEFKEAIPKQVRDLANEIAAFASSGGGLILLGIDDGGRVIGFAEPRERVEGVVQMVEPTPRVHIALRGHSGKLVCAIAVEPGDSPVYYVDHRPYISDGSLSRPAKPDEVLRLVRSRDVVWEREALLKRQAEWTQADDELAAYISRGRDLLETAEKTTAASFFDLARAWWEESQAFLQSAFGASAASAFHTTGFVQVPSGAGDIRDWCSQIKAKLQFLIGVADRHRQDRPQEN